MLWLKDEEINQNEYYLYPIITLFSQINFIHKI